MTLLVLATFGGGMAMIVPMAFSLALRLNELAPGREEFLGYMLGIGSLCSLIAAPLTGILSDRMRSRWGRRRPFTVIGTVLGLAAIPLMAFAPNVVVLGAGWVLSTVGWGTAVGSIGNYQADNLPGVQRGKVSGLTGLTMQISPVIGIILVGRVTADALWVFLLPAAIGTLLVGAFVVLAPEKDTRGAASAGPLSIGSVFRSFVFNPKEHPAFAWTWAGRFVFFLGLTFTTSYATFFYAQRLGISVAEVTTVIAVISAASIVSSTAGALGGGWFSDRANRRQPFILVGAVIYAAGTVVSAFSHDFITLIAGSLISSLGIAVFISVGQALVLDVLPHRETQAGKFMAITSFSQKIPAALAPGLAPVLLSIGATGTDRNYTLLFLAAGALALVGGLITVLGVRETNS
ncbi:MFS transporter [Pseudarthrobacter sp. NS4]|uniref:MFS transporter n=1 Tax=Pseudarthrobacter sp. NS4 TaxID=2973976 RepID=UPI002163A19E|nr:MFS transporter [Pseudarthrobacter sp. NS4]